MGFINQRQFGSECKTKQGGGEIPLVSQWARTRSSVLFLIEKDGDSHG